MTSSKHDMSDIDEIMANTTPVNPGESEPSSPDGQSRAIQVAPEQKSLITFDRGRLLPTDHGQLFRMAERIYHSGVSITNAQSPADVMVALMAGAEIGLGPATTIKSVYIINGKAAIWGDAIVGVAQRSGLYAGHECHEEGKGENLVSICTVRRVVPDPTCESGHRVVEFTESFSWQDAVTAGLHNKKGDMYKKYPKRMLRAKAKTFAFREAFSDVLSGFEHEADEEEIRSFEPSRMRGQQRDDSGSAFDKVLTQKGDGDDE
jgi:hypothetical protein